MTTDEVIAMNEAGDVKAVNVALAVQLGYRCVVENPDGNNLYQNPDEKKLNKHSFGSYNVNQMPWSDSLDAVVSAEKELMPDWMFLCIWHGFAAVYNEERKYKNGYMRDFQSPVGEAFNRACALLWAIAHDKETNGNGHSEHTARH